MRPEAERRMRAGFQRRVHEQANRYAPQLAHARQLAAWFECGGVAGVFGMKAGGDLPRRTYVVALLPLAGIPVMIAISATGIPGTLQLLEAYPFLAGAWMGVSFWTGRTPKRQVWLYAFTDGFVLADDPQADATAVPWSQVTAVTQVWVDVYGPGSEGDPTPTLTAYQLRMADGTVHEISRSFKNVQDPYGEMGQLFRGLAPNTVGKAMPRFPTIDEIIGTYAGQPRRGT